MSPKVCNLSSFKPGVYHTEEQIRRGEFLEEDFELSPYFKMYAKQHKYCPECGGVLIIEPDAFTWDRCFITCSSCNKYLNTVNAPNYAQIGDRRELVWFFTASDVERMIFDEDHSSYCSTHKTRKVSEPCVIKPKFKK